MSNLSPAQQALIRAQAARKQSRSIQTPPRRLDPTLCCETEEKIFGLLEALPAKSTFALRAEIIGDSFWIWEYGPDPASAFGLLQDMAVGIQMGEQAGDDQCFTIPGAGKADQDKSFDDQHAQIEKLVREIEITGHCSLALAWQASDDEQIHFHSVGFSLVTAFRRFGEAMADTVECALDLS